MPFTDRVRIHVEAGHGGGGCLSFRREAHVPRGGPDGGNGGQGGSVFIEGERALEDLMRYRHEVHHRATPGAGGAGRNRRGRDGADLVLGVPLGTRILRDDELLATITDAGQRVEVARGGVGGVGNRAFRSSTHRAPRETVPGAPGEETWLTLDLRLPVEIGIVGLPNSGKSTVLNAITGARAPIGAYPHTTVEPALGNLEDDDSLLHLVADLPGLDDDGAPRRRSYLEQLAEARVILHCVDGSDERSVAGRLERTRVGIAGFARSDARQLVVVTRGEAARDAPGDAVVFPSDGTGAVELRRRLLELIESGH
ncbi:MAG: 50S ribosome-binding GTPase [Actinobacteria bacterium]|nr:50S ribosome-binding GTPase [Actinomycetota bacterium]